MSAPDSALSDAGIPCLQPVQLDGRLHRFKTEGDHDANCWYVFHQGQGFVCGAFGCWKRQINQKWSDVEYALLTPEQKKAARMSMQEIADKAKVEQERAQQEARQSCAKILAESPQASGGHPYLVHKSVKPLGDIKLAQANHVKDWLALPLKDDKGVVWSCQFIACDGTKRFHYGGKVQGCYFEIPGKEGAPILICEGYATGATLHAATGWTVICAMNCGNLLLTGQAIRRLNPTRTIVFCADNDQFTEGNPGLEKARAAAKLVKASVAFPVFFDEALSEHPTDFNDLAAIEGVSAVRIQVNRVFSIVALPIGDFQLPPVNDPSELLSHRFLCRRGGLLITGPTGVGKSSFLIQAAALWSNNLPFFGITPTRCLSTVMVQAENDDGDIAEMRDGICKGMEFHKEQREKFFANVKIHSSTGLTGRRLCEEVIRPLLDCNNPDLLMIDPALSFLGGDVKEQKDVGDFLRQHLNPQLYAHDCACVISHHTNKPKAAKDNSNAPMNGEWAYMGSGSAEWANWARAIISLQSSGKPGVYKIHAGKRGTRIGWRDGDDQALYEKIIIHSREKGVICWHDGDENDMPDSKPEQVGKPAGRKSLVDEVCFSNLHDFISECIPDGEGINEISRRMESYLAKQDIDVSPSTSKRIIRQLVQTKKIIKNENSIYFKGKNA